MISQSKGQSSVQVRQATLHQVIKGPRLVSIYGSKLTKLLLLTSNQQKVKKKEKVNSFFVEGNDSEVANIVSS